MLSIQTIKNIVSRLGKKYGLKSAYLFGSYARGTANDDSDIDIIIDRGALRTYDEYFDLRQDLEAELNTKVDLLANDSLRPKLFESIKQDWIPLYGA